MVKKLIGILVICSALIGSSQVFAFDSDRQAVFVEGNKYAFSIFTVQGFIGDYLILQDNEGVVNYYYRGFLNCDVNTGEEVAVLYDFDTEKVTLIVGVDND